MNGWMFRYGCNHCGHPCRFEAGSADNMDRVTAIVVCESCEAKWQLTVVASLVSGPAARSRQCGTVTGYGQHYRAGEPPCTACKKANQQAKKVARSRRVDVG